MRMRMIVTLMLACSFIAALSCTGRKPVTIPPNAEILGETTVATVNGCRVGSGNFFETADPAGSRRNSIMVSVWRPGDAKSVASTTVFEGDAFDICGKQYRLFRVNTGKKGENGTAYIVPVDK